MSARLNVDSTDLCFHQSFHWVLNLSPCTLLGSEGLVLSVKGRRGCSGRVLNSSVDQPCTQHPAATAGNSIGSKSSSTDVLSGLVSGSGLAGSQGSTGKSSVVGAGPASRGSMDALARNSREGLARCSKGCGYKKVNRFDNVIVTHVSGQCVTQCVQTGHVRGSNRPEAAQLQRPHRAAPRAALLHLPAPGSRVAAALSPNTLAPLHAPHAVRAGLELRRAPPSEGQDARLQARPDMLVVRCVLVDVPDMESARLDLSHHPD
eukprot:1153343-Pelagomonas_calceolata.AAC.3